jgi:hypothetical protein
MNKNKRPQTPKGRNENLMRAMQEKRMSSAAAPHKNKSKYDRKNQSWKKEI